MCTYILNIWDLGYSPETCRECGKQYLDVWRVSDELWRLITGIKDGSGLYCMSCFSQLASYKKIEIYWTGTANEWEDQFNSISKGGISNMAKAAKKGGSGKTLDPRGKTAKPAKQGPSECTMMGKGKKMMKGMM